LEAINGLGQQHRPARVTVKKVIVNHGNGNVYAPGDQNATIESANSSSTPADEQDDDEWMDDASEPEETDEDFEKAYCGFVLERKWTLPSGTVVEDALYKASKDKQALPDVLDCIRNWIIDVDNSNMKALFSEEDWAAIRAAVTPVPPVPRAFAQDVVTRFGQVCAVLFV
jgi:hypothetical protein